MQYYVAVAALASGLIASVSAGNVHAVHHNLHRRDNTDNVLLSTANATCGCTTYTTTWYGEAGLVPGPATTSSSSSSSSSVWVAPTSEAAPTTTSSSSVWSPPPPPPSSSAPAPSSAAPSAPSSSPSNGGLLGEIVGGITGNSNNGGSNSGNNNGGSSGGNGNKWAMTYTPYTSGGQCKSASDVANDIGQIKAKGFSTVRLYATDCSGIQNVGAACNKYNLKMIMGIYIDQEGISKAREQVGQLTSWGESNGWSKVEMVVVGNEAIFNNYCSASELAGFIGEVKSTFKSCGYNGPVTTTEPLDVIQENAGTLCSAVDVIAANIHPFFNGQICASDAGDFVSSQLALLSQACNGAKDAYNLETGWPSAGDANGAAVPGTSQQKQAVDSIVAAAGSRSAIFSFENDSWKAPGDLGVEQYWGCASLFDDIINIVGDMF